jgi:hypothetical protein
MDFLKYSKNLVIFRADLIIRIPHEGASLAGLQNRLTYRVTSIFTVISTFIYTFRDIL